MRLTAAQVRHGIAEGLRAAGPRWWLGIAAVAIVTNLLDFAVVPRPGIAPGAGFFAAAAVRVVAVVYASYALARRTAGIAAPGAPGIALVRYAAFFVVWSVAFAAVSQGVAAAVGLATLPLASQSVTLLAVAAGWGVLLVRLAGLPAGFATGARFDAAGRLVRATAGGGVALALGFLQTVLPFAALHLALTLVGVRLPLSAQALVALSVIDGVVSAAQLLTGTALAVVAWRLAGLQARGARV